jgi:hypothetical protein
MPTSETTPPRLGRLTPPYPVERCASVDCERTLTDETGAYLYRDAQTTRLCVFCEDCGAHAELVAPQRFLLVAL